LRVWPSGKQTRASLAEGMLGHVQTAETLAQFSTNAVSILG